MAKLIQDGKYGQVELNQVAFRRDGHVEAQCALGSAFTGETKCQNGMLLAVDKANNEVTFATDDSLPIALVYSAEHMYDERHNGSLGDFYLGVDGGDFYPRLGYLTVGDIFMTNCVEIAEASYINVNEDTKKVTFTDAGKTALKGAIFGAGDEGFIVAGDPTFGPKLKVINDDSGERGGWTMPNGQAGLKFQVIA